MSKKPEIKTDWGSPLGFGIGIAVILIAMVTLNNPGEPLTPEQKASWVFWFSQFWSTSSIIIVLGGTIAGLTVSLPLDAIANVPKIFANIFKSSEFDYNETIDQILSFAAKARKEGVFSIEKDIEALPEGFMKKGLDAMIIERDASKLRNIIQTEMSNISSRHQSGQDFFTRGKDFAPAFGMMGTVMGLVVMMNNFGGGDDAGGTAETMSKLLSGMGAALITTLYGVIFANLFFIPVSGKLKRLSTVEMRHKTVVMEGILSIHAKEHPIIIKDKLLTFVPPAYTQKHINNKDKK